MKTTKEHMTDEVLKETSRIKESLGMRFDFDVDRIVDSAIENQNKSGRTILSPPNLKYELQRGFESLDRGDISPRSASQIAEDVLKRHLSQ